MQALEVIDSSALEFVCGGQAAPAEPTGENLDRQRGNLGVTVPTGQGNPPLQLGLQYETEQRFSNYAECARTVRGNPSAYPGGLRANCGLPNGQP